MRTITDDTPTNPAVLDATQPCDCAESSAVRMARADKVRNDHSDGVRKAVAEASGEVVAK